VTVFGEEAEAVPAPLLETGQAVRWRGARWRVLGEEEGGLLRLVGLDQEFRDVELTPLLDLERDELLPDVQPLPKLDVEGSDRSRWRALHHAYLTTMAGGREQLVGLDWGAIAVEPYQLVPLLRVARTMRPRLLVADDTGLGKTAEAGIVLRWLAQRHQANRVLVVTRASPEPERWKKELWTKFGFRFDILADGADFNDRRRRNPNLNVFAHQNQKLIVSMTLAARAALRDELRACPLPWDVVIVDEAGHLALRGNRTKQLARLGQVLSAKSEGGALLLLTATPHDGKTESFLSLLRLLEPFVEVAPGEVPLDVASRLVVRRLKPEVTLAGGKKFLEPRIHVVSTLTVASREERAVDGPLDAYLAWLAGEEQRYEASGSRQKATGCQFLAGVLRKRFGSSVAALRATLRRRLGAPPAPEDLDDEVPYVDTDESDPEDDVVDPGEAAATPPPELAPEEARLARALLDAAEAVPQGRDAKLEALSRLLAEELAGEKVVVFTEYRDTLRAAERRLRAEGVSFVTFHGATPEAERDRAITSFLRDPTVRVFLATDAASEGINLHHGAHHLVHLDVPWNPNRYAQRNGRIDRYGQGQTPHIWCLVAADGSRRQGRPEARALEVVVDKLQKIARELGSVGAVLPGYSSGSVRRLLQQAKDDTPERVGELLETPEARQVAEDLSRLSAHNRTEIEQAERYVAGLGTVHDFEAQLGELLRTAFRGWDDGGAIEDLGKGVARVRVPERLRPQLGTAAIERSTFRREVALADEDEDSAPELLSPAHPLVEATLRALRDEATVPDFPHRFDVVAGEPEGLVVSFAVRFVDGEGRTAEESLLAVEVALDASVSRSPGADMARLGIDAPGPAALPDKARIAVWQDAFARLYEAARKEAERRAEARRVSLVELAQELVASEREALGLWRGEEEHRVELLALGRDPQLSFESGQEYERLMGKLEEEYERRRAGIRDRAKVKLAGTDPVGGRLIVRAAQWRAAP
jgi:superfamily II DNA or RNA helicase